MGTTPRKTPHTAREFWEATTPIPLTGCLISLLGRSEYGNAWVEGCQERAAHRVAMELTRGPIPKPMLVLHKCDVPGCVNPDHLYLGTVQDNARDMFRRGRNTAAQERRKARLGVEYWREIRGRVRHKKASAIGTTPGHLLREIVP